jgi:hypothetical protein
VRRYLIAFLVGAVVAAAPAAAQAQSAQSQALAASWYARFLGRPVDAAGSGWAVALDQGQRPEKLLAALLGSPEYYQRTGGTPENYVQSLFLDLTGRRPTPAEYSLWIRRLLHTRGEQPGYDELTDLAYAMLLRYPQSYQPPPVVVAPPPVVVPEIRDRDRRDWDHDDYEYRRPVYPRERWDHDRDHHDEHRP